MKKTTVEPKSIQKAVQNTPPKLRLKEISEIQSISAGTALVSGLSDAQINELLSFKDGVIGMVYSLSEDGVGVVFLSNADNLKAF